MKGKNQILMNQATMREVVQRWVDAELPNTKAKVDNVSVSSTSSGNVDNFTITLVVEEGNRVTQG